MAAVLARRVSGVYCNMTFKFSISLLSYSNYLTGYVCNDGPERLVQFISTDSCYVTSLASANSDSTQSFSPAAHIVLSCCPCVSQGCWGRCLRLYKPGHHSSVTSPASFNHRLSMAALQPPYALLCGVQRVWHLGTTSCRGKDFTVNTVCLSPSVQPQQKAVSSSVIGRLC